MSMDSVIYYRTRNSVRGVYVNDGVHTKNIAAYLRETFGYSRGALVEWVEEIVRGEFDTHLAEDHDDNALNESAVLDSGADQFLLIGDDGSITDVSREVFQKKTLP